VVLKGQVPKKMLERFPDFRETFADFCFDPLMERRTGVS
jgi:hypothetical protein